MSEFTQEEKQKLEFVIKTILNIMEIMSFVLVDIFVIVVFYVSYLWINAEFVITEDIRNFFTEFCAKILIFAGISFILVYFFFIRRLKALNLSLNAVFFKKLKRIRNLYIGVIVLFLIGGVFVLNII